MQLLSLENVSFAYGEVKILEEFNVKIKVGDRIAIVGANGTGKSTFLSLLAGEKIPTSGILRWHRKMPTTSYFQQELEIDNRIVSEDGDALVNRKKWGISKEIQYAQASGGERMKMRLSTTFASNANLLLLDEPTNHLDSQSVEQLIEMINGRHSTYFIVSHDRYFIDQVANYIFEIEDGRLTVYKGNYTSYREQKEENRRTTQMHYEQQQREIKRVEEQVNQLSNWSGKAHAESTKKDGTKEYFRKKAKKRDVQIKSKKKRLEAELNKNRIHQPNEELTVTFDVKGQKRKGRRVLELQNVQKGFSHRLLFKDVSFTVQAGERIALVGPNGAGKTTLFKMLLGQETYEGDLWKSDGVTIGYLSQTIFDLPEDCTLEQYFHADTFEEQGMIRTNLMNLGFSKKHWLLPIKNLSMGERVKVKLMQFILEGTDVLLLDEPTNHLDLPSREALEETLASFPGTLLFASHDRYFTERMANDVLVLANNTIKKMYLTYEAWQSSNDRKNNGEREKEKLRLETELQAVLGKLSLLNSKDEDYRLLDEAYNSILKQIKKLD